MYREQESVRIGVRPSKYRASEPPRHVPCEQTDGSIKLHLDKTLPDAVAAAEPAFVERLLCEAVAAGATPPELDEFDIACHTGGPRVLHEVAVEWW